MPLYEYHCNDCQKNFEALENTSDTRRGECPWCGQTHSERLISGFAVGGQGDLRESTLHGCHGAFDPTRDRSGSDEH